MHGSREHGPRAYGTDMELPPVRLRLLDDCKYCIYYHSPSAYAGVKTKSMGRWVVWLQVVYKMFGHKSSLVLANCHAW